MNPEEIGSVQFLLTGKTDTFEKLKGFMVGLGFNITHDRHYENEPMFNRITGYFGRGLQFEIVWFVNVCTIKIGEEDGDLIETDFNSIIASLLPREGYKTLDFMYNGRRTSTILVKEKKDGKTQRNV